MAKLGINTGTTPNDGTGDTLLSAALKINQNFNEIYSAIGNGTSITNQISYSNSSGVSSYSSVSGVSTYSNSSGISSVSEGLTGTPNISVGIISAISYQGDGSELVGIVTYITAGAGVTISQNNGNVTINASGGGGGVSQWETIGVGIHTIFNVGVGTTNPTSKLTVSGDVLITGVSTFSGITTVTGATLFTKQLNVSGISTFVTAPIFNNGAKFINDSSIDFGTSTNASLSYHTSSSSVRLFANNTNVNLFADNFNFYTSVTQSALKIIQNAQVELYYNNSKKFETLGVGVTITGTNFANQLNISGISTFNKTVYLNASNSEYIGFYLNRPNGGYANWTYNYTYDQFLFQSYAAPLIINSKDYIQITSGNGVLEEILAQFNYNGSVDLYHDNSKKFATTGTGVTVTGSLSVSGISTFSGALYANDIRVANSQRIYIGDNANLTIGFDPANGETLIRNQTSVPLSIDLASNSNSTLTIKNNAFTLGQFSRSGVELYNSGTRKFQTVGSGVSITGTTITNQLNVSGVSTFSQTIYESVSNSFSTNLIPVSGTLTVPVTTSILVGTLGSTVTTWNFTGINTSSPSSVTVSMVIDSNSLYTYGDTCQVNGLPITGGIRWAGGLPPIATNNEDILSFTVITDASGVVRVYGSSTLNYS